MTFNITTPDNLIIYSVIINVILLVWFFFRPKRIIEVQNKPYSLFAGKVSAKWTESLHDQYHYINITTSVGNNYKLRIEEQYWKNCIIGETQIWVAL